MNALMVVFSSKHWKSLKNDGTELCATGYLTRTGHGLFVAELKSRCVALSLLRQRLRTH